MGVYLGVFPPWVIHRCYVLEGERMLTPAKLGNATLTFLAVFFLSHHLSVRGGAIKRGSAALAGEEQVGGGNRAVVWKFRGCLVRTV